MLYRLRPLTTSTGHGCGLWPVFPPEPPVRWRVAVVPGCRVCLDGGHRRVRVSGYVVRVPGLPGGGSLLAVGAGGLGGGAAAPLPVLGPGGPVLRVGLPPVKFLVLWSRAGVGGWRGQGLVLRPGGPHRQWREGLSGPVRVGRAASLAVTPRVSPQPSAFSSGIVQAATVQRHQRPTDVAGGKGANSNKEPVMLPVQHHWLPVAVSPAW
jgi:hypothetical protein